MLFCSYVLFFSRFFLLFSSVLLKIKYGECSVGIRSKVNGTNLATCIFHGFYGVQEMCTLLTSFKSKFHEIKKYFREFKLTYTVEIVGILWH